MATALPPANFSATDCTDYLLRDSNILDRSFDYNLSLIFTLSKDLKMSERKSDAAELEKVCIEKLLELNEQILHRLLEITEIDDKNLAGFGRALALMDLALFHNKVQHQGQALKLDTVLEAIRELPHELRIEGWKLDAVSTVLGKILGDKTAESCKSSGLENKLNLAICTLREHARKRLRELIEQFAADYGMS